MNRPRRRRTHGSTALYCPRPPYAASSAWRGGRAGGRCGGGYGAGPTPPPAAVCVLGPAERPVAAAGVQSQTVRLHSWWGGPAAPAWRRAGAGGAGRRCGPGPAASAPGPRYTAPSPVEHQPEIAATC